MRLPLLTYSLARFGRFRYLHAGIELLAQHNNNIGVPDEDKIRTVALLSEDVAFTMGICDGAVQKAQALGLNITRFNITGTIPYNASGSLPAFNRIVVSSGSNPNKTQIALALRAIQQMRPDAVIGCTYYEVCVEFLKQAGRANFYAKAFLFTVCVTDPRFVEDFANEKSFAGWVLGATPWSEDDDRPDAIMGLSPKSFANMYKDQYGNAPPYQAVAAYAGAQLLVQAIEEAGSLNHTLVAARLKATRLRTVYGDTSFDANRQNVLPFVTVQLKVERNNETNLDELVPRIVTETTVTLPIPKKSLRFGVLLPTTGSWPIALATAGAIVAAVDAINRNPRLLPGYRLEFVLRDDGCTAAQSLSALSGLLYDKGIKGIIGPACDSACEATALLTAGNNVLQISPTCSSPTLTDRMKYPTVRAGLGAWQASVCRAICCETCAIYRGPHRCTFACSSHGHPHRT